MKIPYPLTAAVAPVERYAQMSHAIAVARERGYPRLTRQPIDERATILIACYGPSLLDTWETLRDLALGGQPILSMSGATRFLADRGLTPTWHVDMDPRPYKANHIDPPVGGVHYLMASVCPPRTWDLLRDEQVTLWHTQTDVHPDGRPVDSWVAQEDAPGALIIHGGSTIGLTAIHIGGALGARHFEIFGMDGSFAGVADSAPARHAGVHFGKSYAPNFTWNAEGRTYHTTQIMANAVAESVNTAKNFPIFTIWHGDGLTQALIRELNVPHAATDQCGDKVDRVRRGYYRTIGMPTIAGPHTASPYWDAIADAVPPAMLPELLANQQRAERLRHLAAYNTGTITLEAALLLRGLCVHYQPAIIAEIGTFIGTSTYALQARSAIYTCDNRNDCLAADPTRGIRTHPRQSSTEMFTHMLDVDHLAQSVDLFFLDGRLTDADLPLIERLGHPKSIFICDDCHPSIGGGKGIANLEKLTNIARDHAVVPPTNAYDQRVTLGALIPFLTPTL